MSIKDEIIKKIQKRSNLTLDDKGYVKTAEENLIMNFPNWSTIKEELMSGGGSELKPPKFKFHAAHSSSSLCVNNFALIKEHVGEIDLFGLGKFFTCEFEKGLTTVLGEAYLDVYFTNAATICGVESKYSEIFTQKLPNQKQDDVGNLTKYKNGFERLVKRGIPQSFEKDILDFYIDCNDKLYFDAAQLIKHTLALTLEGIKTGKKPVLVYIYWEPKNDLDAETKDALDYHKKEVADFAKRIAKYIDFKSLTYNELWGECEKYEFLKDSVAKNRARYEM